MVLPLAGLVLVVLGALALVAGSVRSGIDPVRETVSDIGASPYRRWYQLMCVLTAAGAALYSADLARRDLVAVGAVAWLLAYAAFRAVIAWVPTDRTGSGERTRTGRLHAVLAAGWFTTIGVGAGQVSGGLADRGHVSDGSVLVWLGRAVGIAALAMLVAFVVPRLRRVVGAVERVLYAVVIGWLVVLGVVLMGIPAG